MAKSGVRWYYNSLVAGLRAFPLVVNGRIDERMKQTAEDIEEYMRQNAPWDDETGDARAGLTAEHSGRGFRHTIDLYHTVDYGIWLEVRWSGQYAIIIPTVEKFGPTTMANLNGLI